MVGILGSGFFGLPWERLMSLPLGYCSDGTLPSRFALFLRYVGRSASTIQLYVDAVRAWLAFEATARADGQSEETSLQRFVATRRDTVAAATVNVDVKALRAYFRWLEISAPQAWRPVELPRLRRVPPRLVRALSDGEVGMLLAAPDLTTFVGLRDHLIIATLYQCGLRAGELVNLQVGSVRLDGMLLVQGKGQRERLVPFGAGWHGLFETYLRGRASLRAGKKAALFLTQQGRPLRDARSVWVIVNRYARQAPGLGCGYAHLSATTGGKPWSGHYPHLLRASFATELVRNGCSLVAVSQMLGHADMSTTARYIGVDLSDLRRAAAHHPRACLDMDV